MSGDYLCPECGLPLCDEKCYSAKKHHVAECEMLREEGAKQLFSDGNPAINLTIFHRAPPTGFKMKVLFNRQV